MFNPFKSEGPAAGQDSNFVVSDELRIAIDEAGLNEDPAVNAMLETGFVGPNGREWDPIEFIEQRKATLLSDKLGAEAPANLADNMVEHSPRPESEPRAELL